ncbi:unknown [Bacteroides sp. CAG:462]|nr:unknown [Bacteroides sp. CAG:462]
MASTIADNVSKFKLKPISFMAKKVAIKATGMAIAGINVERISCRKIYTTMNTRINASINVLTTS